MYVQQLTQLGLNSGEAKIYNYLIRFGDSSASQIAKMTDLGRTNVYEYAKSLKQKGLLIEFNKNKKLYYQADNPTKLKQLLDRKLIELTQINETAQEFIDQLGDLFVANYSLPQLENLIGEQGFFKMWKKFLPELHAGSSCILLAKSSGDYQDVFMPSVRNELVSKNITTLLLLNQEEGIKDLSRRDEKEKRKTIYVPASKILIKTTSLVGNNSLIYGNFGKKNFNVVFLKSLELTTLTKNLVKNLLI